MGARIKVVRGHPELKIGDMKKSYVIPEILVHGDVRRITGLFGNQQIQDVLVNPAGQVVQTGTGSIDACPTQNPAPGAPCLINP
jgi:hypothetical protein